MSSIIIPNLFIGSIEDRQDTATLRSHDIRLIVCCCHSGWASLFSFIPTGGNTKEVEFEDATVIAAFAVFLYSCTLRISRVLDRAMTVHVAQGDVCVWVFQNVPRE